MKTVMKVWNFTFMALSFIIAIALVFVAVDSFQVSNILTRNPEMSSFFFKQGLALLFIGLCWLVPGILRLYKYLHQTTDNHPITQDR